MSSRRFAVATVAVAAAAALVVFGCSKSSNKSTNPNVAPLEMDHTLAPGATFSHRFLVAGAYPYHCTFHAAMGMTGIVVVSGSANAADSLQGVTAAYPTFAPNSVTIPVNGVVTWTNGDGAITHTVTSD